MKDYDLARYPGPLHRDGVQAIIDTVMGSAEPVTLIAIGPAPNIRAALEREPGLAARAHFVGMYGSFGLHHETNLNNRVIHPGAIPEFNVKRDIPAAQAVFAAPWRSLTIMPLDTCGFIMLDGARYERVRAASDPLMRAVLENYRMWSPRNGENDCETHTSVLFDTVAVYLAITRDHLKMKRMGVRVDDQGFTVEDAGGAAGGRGAGLGEPGRLLRMAGSAFPGADRGGPAWERGMGERVGHDGTGDVGAGGGRRRVVQLGGVAR